MDKETWEISGKAVPEDFWAEKFLDHEEVDPDGEEEKYPVQPPAKRKPSTSQLNPTALQRNNQSPSQDQKTKKHKNECYPCDPSEADTPFVPIASSPQMKS
jgi:hypothetical protein